MRRTDFSLRSYGHTRTLQLPESYGLFNRQVSQQSYLKYVTPYVKRFRRAKGESHFVMILSVINSYIKIIPILQGNHLPRFAFACFK